MNAVDYKQWIGSTDSTEDLISSWPMIAMNATLNYDAPAPKAGDALPPAWHWLYFLEARRAGELGYDGHPKRGGFLPPVALPRRMWAGGRIEFLTPIRIGDHVKRKSTILNVESKRGATGELVFVTVQHEILVHDRLAVREEHDIVYREAAKPGDPPPRAKPAPKDTTWRQEIKADTTMLFRYSALTFNGHRIHYDLDFARNQERYPGLIVHGPLQATLLLELCRNYNSRTISKFDYRALHPVFHTETFSVNGKLADDTASAALWTSNGEGNYAMTASAHFA